MRERPSLSLLLEGKFQKVGGEIGSHEQMCYSKVVFFNLTANDSYEEEKLGGEAGGG